MESIRYNIELEDSNLNEQQKADITLLDKFLHDLLKSHMRIDKAYDSAKWTIG
jgi:hypothetical protein